MAFLMKAPVSCNKRSETSTSTSFTLVHYYATRRYTVSESRMGRRKTAATAHQKHGDGASRCVFPIVKKEALRISELQPKGCSTCQFAGCQVHHRFMLLAVRYWERLSASTTLFRAISNKDSLKQATGQLVLGSARNLHRAREIARYHDRHKFRNRCKRFLKESSFRNQS